MFDLLTQIFTNLENLRGRNLLKVLAIVFVVFIVIGGLIGYVNSFTLSKNEPAANNNTQVPQKSSVSYKGIVTYLGEDMYLQDKIKYSLTDQSGNDIILLKASDDKLSIAQGMSVTVTGKKIKALDGKTDVLQVTEVTLKNGSN